MSGCAVLSGSFTFAVQGCLFLISLTVLVFKFRRDAAGRSLKHFAFDSSKQIAGAGWVHVANLACATVLGKVKEDNDACAWYWIQIIVDCTLGVFVEYCLLFLVAQVLRLLFGERQSKELTSGHCISKAGRLLRIVYVKQIIVWLMVCTCMKFLMVALMLAGAPQFQEVAQLALAPVRDQPHVKLLVVMIFIPAIMNAVQFWLVDNIFVSFHRAAQALGTANGEETSLDQGLLDKGHDEGYALPVVDAIDPRELCQSRAELHWKATREDEDVFAPAEKVAHDVEQEEEPAQDVEAQGVAGKGCCLPSKNFRNPIKRWSPKSDPPASDGI